MARPTRTNTRPAGPRRGLGAVRLSHLTDATTSPDTQRQLIIGESAVDLSAPIEIVAWAEDLDISAADYAPQDRPALGPYLTDPELIDSYDVILWAKLDRAIRSTLDLHWLLRFAKDHGKEIIFVKDRIDTSTPIGVAVATFMAAVGEIEIQNMVERRSRASAYLRTTIRWPGGPAPYGYTIVDNPSGPGRVLATNPDHAEIMREVVRRVIAGESLNAIADDLNERGIPTSRSRAKQRERNKLEPKGWGNAVLGRVLRSRALLGQKEQQVTNDKGFVVDRRLLLDAAGQPIQFGEPLISLEEWQDLQAALDSSSRPSVKGQANTPNPLAGVLVCSECARGLARHAPRTRPERTHKYLCYTRGCRKTSAYSLDVWQALSDSLLSAIGDQPVRTRVYVKGNDSSAELADVEKRLTDLREARYVRGEFDGEEAEWSALMGALKARRDSLTAATPRKAGWQWVDQGQTYREVWESYGEDTEKQGALLRQSGIKATLSPAPLGQLHLALALPDDLLQRLGATVPPA